MQIISTPNLEDRLSSAHLLVDTCTLVDMSKSVEFRNLVFSYAEQGCTLATIPPVEVEFLGVASGTKEQDELRDFLKSCKLSFLSDIERKLSGTAFSNFLIALRRSKVKSPSYVDTILLFVPCFYQGTLEDVYIMTANHKDVPLEFFDRIGLIVCDNGIEVHTEGVYQLNKDKFMKIIQ